MGSTELVVVDSLGGSLPVFGEEGSSSSGRFLGEMIMMYKQKGNLT